MARLTRQGGGPGSCTAAGARSRAGGRTGGRASPKDAAGRDHSEGQDGDLGQSTDSNGGPRRCCSGGRRDRRGGGGHGACTPARVGGSAARSTLSALMTAGGATLTQQRGPLAPKSHAGWDGEVHAGWDGEVVFMYTVIITSHRFYDLHI